MKNVKKFNRFLMVIVVLAAGFSGAQALADEGVARVKLSYGMSSYSSPSTYADIGSTYANWALGVSYIWPSNIFVDFTTKSSMSDASYNSRAVSNNPITSDESFSRMENTVTMGMPLENGLQVNAGVFTADTTSKLPQSGQITQKLNGISTGVGKAFPIKEGKSGAFSLNGGFALLNGSLIDKFGGVTASSLAYGLSVGGAYSYALNKNLSVAVDTKLQSYFIRYATFSGDERILSASLSLIGQY